MNKIKQNNHNNSFILFKSVSDIEKYNFYEYLSVMIDAGLSIGDVLDSFLEKSDNLYFKEKIYELKTYISS
jgi:type II secretory pathway component PulF